jgi:hypothetical protein
MSNEEKPARHTLRFNHLPAFAGFLLKDRLREFTAVQLDLSFEVDFPILKQYTLSGYTRDQLIDLSIPVYRAFLEAAAENRLEQYIGKVISTWENDQLPEITRDQLVIEDLTLATYVRKKALLSFIREYTADVDTALELVREADDYSLEANSQAFRAFLRIHRERIDGINRSLTEQEAELLQAQELSGLGSFEWDLSGKGSSKYTPQVYKIFEMEQTSTLVDFMTYVHPADRKLLEDALAQAMKNGEYECEYRYQRNGKDKVLWSKGLVHFNGDQPVSMKGTVMDVTDRHRILQELERNEERYKLAQKLSHIGNWSFDLESGQIEFSEEMRRIYGLSAAEEVTLEMLIAVVHSEDREVVMKHLEDSINHNVGHEVTFRIIRKDGLLRVIRQIAEVISDELGNPQKVTGTGQDITREIVLTQELKEREEKLRELNISLEQKNRALEWANKELTSFSYVASHDLQEPVRKIRTFTNLIMETETNLSESGKDCFNRIVTSAGRMQKLIDDLLSFSRTQVFENVQSPVDLNLVFSEINSFYKESITEGRLVIECSQLPVIQAIPFQIHQLMQNIISNSIKYSRPDKKTRVHVKAELVDAKHLPYSIVKKDVSSYHKISITDNGIGFDQIYSEKIFEMFQRLHGRTEYSGTGIGLSICKKIVENHQGFISATGIPDKGATFDVYLPS